MNRKCVKLNGSIKLKVLFYDDCKEATNVDNLSLTVTNPNGASTVFNQFTNVDTGFYYLNYTGTTVSGEYTELWSATIDGTVVTKELKFEVVTGGLIYEVDTGLKNNELVVIELSPELKSTDGNKLQLKEYLSFSTIYDPFYCSVDMLSMELGPWAGEIPEDTMALAIHWSSLQADHITGKRPVSDRYEYARTRYVMYDAAIRLLTMPVGPDGRGGGQKELGDLMISKGNLDFDIKSLLAELKLERDEWWRIVNAGGDIVSGQSLGTTFAEKGSRRSDKLPVSRGWHDPFDEYYVQPTANSKYKRTGESKYKSGYSRWSEYYYSNIPTRYKR